ncbi:short-chain dehydrogenase [Bordetella trematum]|uniref:Short-chain dehydrogenase/reductase n=1 Tax=Bordetella trematum TaxID=123899 RepID=A0A157S7M9_9BORD|nr:SDR family oxidoreductase [Bordetella trematum]AUL49266.1 short-chain dehydrogenase [Bordetella trematum]AZR96234.1 short-chain dehydrogenase [Bordetella trematum]NNH18536.1 SDR family oxidoreductase [Bordetella trematum]QIM69992.1 SDR family oxidoreductase [Bordetella trematum]SAI37077.1 short-chain dehydrogenase/reductase [Bordetella trematum]
MQRYANQVVLISGGLGDMGLAIGERLGQEGALVVLGDIARPDQAALGARFGSRIPEVLALDVTSPESWRAVVDTVLQRHGRLDVLVNNAGVVSRESVNFDQIDATEWQRLFAINVDGVFHGVQAAMRVMKGQPEGGAIVNMGSIAGFVGSATGGAYGTSKSALRNLTQQAALSAARAGYRVRVNAVHPGYVWTALIAEKLTAQFGGIEAAQHAVRAMNPMQTIVTPQDVAAAVAFLGSADARLITGADLVVDGGRLIQ